MTASIRQQAFFLSECISKPLVSYNNRKQKSKKRIRSAFKSFQNNDALKFIMN